MHEALRKPFIISILQNIIKPKHTWRKFLQYTFKVRNIAIWEDLRYAVGNFIFKSILYCTDNWTTRSTWSIVGNNYLYVLHIVIRHIILRTSSQVYNRELNWKKNIVLSWKKVIQLSKKIWPRRSFFVSYVWLVIYETLSFCHKCMHFIL